MMYASRVAETRKGKQLLDGSRPKPQPDRRRLKPMKVEPAEAEGSKGGGGAGNRAVGRALAAGVQSGARLTPRLDAPASGRRGRGAWVDTEEGGPVPFKEVGKTRVRSQWRMPLSGELGKQVRRVPNAKTTGLEWLGLESRFDPGTCWTITQLACSSWALPGDAGVGRRAGAGLVDTGRRRPRRGEEHAAASARRVPHCSSEQTGDGLGAAETSHCAVCVRRGERPPGMIAVLLAASSASEGNVALCTCPSNDPPQSTRTLHSLSTPHVITALRSRDNPVSLSRSELTQPWSENQADYYWMWLCRTVRIPTSSDDVG